MMKAASRFLAATLAMLLVPAPGSAQDHVVSAADVHTRLTIAAAERDEAVRVVQSALGAEVAALSDAELRDVIARSQRLTDDPVAGTHPVVWVLAVIGGIVVLAFALSAICITRGECE